MTRLRWTGADALEPGLRELLLGPGGAFELRTETILGDREVEVFAQRPADLRGVLARPVAATPDRVYLLGPQESLTYRQVDEETARIAATLAADYGITAGDRVAIMAANTIDHALLIWGVLRAGGVVVGLNGWWTPTETRHGLDLVAPALLLADGRRRAVLDSVGGPVTELAALRAQAAAADPVSPEIDLAEDDPALILFTSGTTGRAKAATQSHRAIVHFGQVNLLRAAVGALTSTMALDPDFQPSFLSVNPLFHVSGSTVLLGAAPWVGAKVVYPEPGRWDPGTHLRLSAEHKIASWSAVPTQLAQLIDHEDFGSHDLSHLRAVISGGAAMPPSLIARFAQRLPSAVPGTGYGASETAGAGTGINGDEYRAHPTSVGSAIPTLEIEVRRDDDTSADDGEVGEVCVRGASVFTGYWNNPTATAEALAPGGWYRSRDFGRVQDGRLYLVGRGADIIIRGGENISALEIENRLAEHPDVEEVAVLGIDHSVLGQEVAAAVVCRADAGITGADLQAWAAEELAAFKVPAHVVFVGELPHTASGKVRKTELAAVVRP